MNLVDLSNRPSVRLFRRLVQRRIVLIALVALFGLLLVTIFAPWIAPYGPNEMRMSERLMAPGSLHPFGTDEFGRDVLSRMVYGARTSMLVSLTVMLVAITAGTLLGLVAGYVRPLDGPLMRITDAMMAFPDILLAIALVAVLGAGTTSVIFALSIVYTPRVARVVRAATLVLREMQFVDAAESLGVRRSRIMFSHILPNLSSTVMVQATFVFAYAILTEAALSFLGIGVPPTIPTWGNMISAAQQYIQQARWLIIAPGLAIALTVVTLQIVGDGIRDALDPKLRRLL